MEAAQRFGVGFDGSVVARIAYRCLTRNRAARLLDDPILSGLYSRSSWIRTSCSTLDQIGVRVPYE